MEYFRNIPSILRCYEWAISTQRIFTDFPSLYEKLINDVAILTLDFYSAPQNI